MANAQMREMIFGTAPMLDSIIVPLQTIEDRFNKK
jgi:hypothetical protein